MKNSSLATQLIFFILTSAAAIFLAAFMYSYEASREGIIREASENARHLAQATAGKIEVVLRSAAKTPTNLAAAIQDYPYNQENLVRLIHRLVETNSEIFGVAIAFEPHAFHKSYYYFCPYAYREGRQVKVIYLGSHSYNYFVKDWYQEPKELNRPVWSEPYFDEGGGNIIMSTFSVPFYQGRKGGGRKFEGVVTADLSLSWLEDIISAVKIFQTGYAFLISQTGVFVTSPNQDLIMRESIFSLAEARNDPKIRQVGRDMIRGGEGFVPIPAALTGKKSWLYYTPLPSTGWSLGVVFPDDELFADARSLMQRTVVVGVLGLGLLALVITIISRGITKPLRVLAQKTGDIAHGDFTATAPETGPLEIAHLARSFNRLGRELTDYMEKRDFIRDTFGRYVTQEVVKRLLEDKGALEMGGETREVSIIMCDLRGFTAITADMHPEQVVIFLNRYLGKMIEILTEHQAVIDEIVGDGILAFFGAPNPMPDHPARAVACALQMQMAMEEINVLNEADGLPHLEMGIAVNTGEVVVGNIGSERRTKYSVVGAHVNFTSRIEAFAMGGQVLISPDTYEKVRELVQVRGEVRAQMKGVADAVIIYDVQAIGEPYNLSLTTKCEVMTRLSRPLEVRLDLMKDKIVIGIIADARITEICDSAARIVGRGEWTPWQDVRLRLLDENRAELPGKIYGKVTAVTPGADGGQTAEVRFTSVSPESRQALRQAR